MSDEPSFDAVDLEVNPPEARYAQDTPQRRLLPQRADGKPLKHQKVAETERHEQRQSETEKKDVQWELETGRLGRNGEEGGDTRTWEIVSLENGQYQN